MGEKLAVPNLTDSQKLWQSVIDNQLSLNTLVNEWQEKTEKHHQILIEGNGEIPLLERMRNAEAFIGGMRYWLRFIGGALVIQTLAFATSVIIAVVKFLPVLERIADQP